MSDFSFIVGDAGGTSTQWRVVKDGIISQFETIGFNAYTHSIEDLKTDVRRVFGDEIVKDAPTFIYAAGVDTKEQSLETKESLESLFGSNVYVENDLLGVARSLCGTDSGNVCILGTGANACFYDGKMVNKVSSSLGYILGDEGSGAYLGKKLLQGVFRNQLSLELVDEFKETFQLNSNQTIQKLYNDPEPNRFLSSFTHFLHERRNKSEVYTLVNQSFEDFFNAFYYRRDSLDYPLYFSGSIAYYFSDILREVASSRGFYIKNIIQSPIAGLVLYHQENDQKDTH
ncbi:MAG: hypothetical protein HRT61_21615 [Ekhidna sp.]|nr:hypothetical protein [Ekhidna sp.]